MPAGLRESDQLPEPIFTPATKADDRPRREHRLRAARSSSSATARWPSALRDVSIAVYQRAAEHARERGIILADTKFEFGLDADGDADARRRGAARPTRRASGPPTSTSRAAPQPSFDKQFVRDWASSTGWDRTPPAPAIPDDVVARTRDEVPRGVRADHRRAVRRLAARGTGGGPMRARVLVRPKAGILDPQGQAVERALPALGFEGVSDVHVGRLIELEVDDPDAAARDVRAAAREPADRGLRDHLDERLAR